MDFELEIATQSSVDVSGRFLDAVENVEDIVDQTQLPAKDFLAIDTSQHQVSSGLLSPNFPTNGSCGYGRDDSVPMDGSLSEPSKFTTTTTTTDGSISKVSGKSQTPSQSQVKQESTIL